MIRLLDGALCFANGTLQVEMIRLLDGALRFANGTLQVVFLLQMVPYETPLKNLGFSSPNLGRELSDCSPNSIKTDGNTSTIWRRVRS
jgi:hypothetical protein